MVLYMFYISKLYKYISLHFPKVEVNYVKNIINFNLSLTTPFRIRK